MATSDSQNNRDWQGAYGMSYGSYGEQQNGAYGEQSHGAYGEPHGGYQQPYAQQPMQGQSSAGGWAAPAPQGYAQQSYGAQAPMPAGAPAPAAAYVMPATSIPVEPERKHKRRAGFWIGLIIAIIAVILGIILAWFFLVQQQQPSSRAGSLGQLEGKTQAEIEEELNRRIEDGMFNISIASNVEFEDGTSEGALKIENVPNNPYLMQVDITRDDTGGTIYSSGILEPNYHVQSDKLDVDLDPGTYECTAVFHALDPETEEEVGQAGAALTIIVKN